MKEDLNHMQSVLYVFGCSCIRPVNQMETERKVTHYIRLRVVLCSCTATCVVLIQNANCNVRSLFCLTSISCCNFLSDCLSY